MAQFQSTYGEISKLCKSYRYIDTFKHVSFKVIKSEGFYRIDKKDSKFKDLSELIHFSKEEEVILSGKDMSSINQYNMYNSFGN